MKKSAFTLVELSIVLAIIGIIVVGVSQGGVMIGKARLANARAITASAPVADIDGLLAWYETSLKDSLLPSESIKGSEINTWYDISPSSINEQKNTLSKTSDNVDYRIKGINNVPSIAFSGSGYMALSNLHQGATNIATVFVVFRPEESISSNLNVLLDNHVNYDRFSVGVKATQIHLHSGTGVNTSTSNNPASVSENNNYILAAYFNGDKSAAFLNDASTAVGYGYVDSGGNNSLQGLTIGARRAGGARFTGLISEVIVYNSLIKKTNRTAIMRYLSQKYKIAVSGI